MHPAAKVAMMEGFSGGSGCQPSGRAATPSSGGNGITTCANPGTAAAIIKAAAVTPSRRCLDLIERLPSSPVGPVIVNRSG